MMAFIVVSYVIEQMKSFVKIQKLLSIDKLIHPYNKKECLPHEITTYSQTTKL